MCLSPFSALYAPGAIYFQAQALPKGFFRFENTIHYSDDVVFVFGVGGHSWLFAQLCIPIEATQECTIEFS